MYSRLRGNDEFSWLVIFRTARSHAGHHDRLHPYFTRTPSARRITPSSCRHRHRRNTCGQVTKAIVMLSSSAAGFAGAACALAAAQCGLRACLLERKRDPGIKLHTTGIIVREAAERTWLSRLPAHIVHHAGNVRLHAPNLRALRLSSPGYYFLTTDTPNVLRWLADESPSKQRHVSGPCTCCAGRLIICSWIGRLTCCCIRQRYAGHPKRTIPSAWISPLTAHA